MHHFLKKRETGLTMNVHARHSEKKKGRERERSHAGHASQSSIRMAMPGMKMDEMSCKKRTKE